MQRLGTGRWIGWGFMRAGCWIGVYWETRPAHYYVMGATPGSFKRRAVADWHLWVCLVPCLPIHFIQAIYES